MTKKALITGITGQDGSYLAELLLEKGYEVYGLIRRHSTSGNLWRIERILDDINLVYGDITDQSSLYELHIRSERGWNIKATRVHTAIQLINKSL